MFDSFTIFLIVVTGFFFHHPLYHSRNRTYNALKQDLILNTLYCEKQFVNEIERYRIDTDIYIQVHVNHAHNSFIGTQTYISTRKFTYTIFFGGNKYIYM